MSGITDTATVTLNVNGAQAKQMMSELETKIKQTEDKITSLKSNMADPKEIEKSKKELRSYQKQLDDMKSATEGVTKALGNIDTATPRQLEKALRTLNKQLKDMTPGSDVWESHIEQIQDLKARLAELKDEVSGQESMWDQFKGWATGAWPALDLLGDWYDSFIGNMRDLVDAYAEMDQEMANVRKFTGMTEDQVAELNEEFKKMDTRTSREDLNKLAQEAGRLGKTSVEDVLGFVKAADKINVALDDLGEGATLTLSKLTGIFGDEAKYGTEQSLLKVGSVINELSQNCAASAPYLTNFTERMGGVGAQAGLTVQQIMGFGAVLDSNAQKVEASATALSQVIVRLYQDPAKYAKVAGLEVESFSKLMREDANAALILFLETLQKSGGMDVLSPMFKDMGENGSRAISALSTLATHIDQVKAQQEAANLAFKEGISIDNEFEVQNNTVQAGLEKCRKAAHELQVELGGRLEPVMSHFLTSSSAVLRGLMTVISFIDEHKSTIITLSAALGAHFAILKLHALWLDRIVIKTILVDKATKALTVTQRLFSGLTATLRLGMAALANSFDYLRNGLSVTYTMQERWRKSMQAMNLSSWTGLVLGLASAVYLLVKHFRDLAEAEKVVEHIREDALKKVGEQRVKIDMLVAAANNENLSLEEKERALIKLNSIIPDYNAELDKTTGKYKANTQALEDYITQLTRKYELEGAEGKLKDLGRQKAEATLALNDAKSNYLEAKSNSGAGFTYTSSYGMVGNTSADVISHAEFRLRKAEADVKRIERLEEKIKAVYGVDFAKRAISTENEPESPEGPADLNPDPDIPTTDNGSKERFAKEKAWRERQEAEARIAYAKGEASYSEHTARMADIATDYHQMLLDRDDLSADERLSIQADYWEALHKEVVVGNKELVDEEERNYNDLLDRLRSNHQERLQSEVLNAQQRLHEKEYYDEVLELAEMEHLRRLTLLYDEGSDEWLEAQRKYQDKQVSAQERHLKKAEDLEQNFSSIKTKYFGMNQEEKDSEFNQQFNLLKDVYNKELETVGNNEAEKLRLKEAFMAAELAMRKQYNQKGAEDSASSYKTAIGKSVEWLNSEGGQTLAGSLSTITSGMSSIFSGLSSMIQAELEIQTAKIEKRYDREIELAQGNSYKVAKLEKKKEADIAKAKNEANRKMFAMQVIQAVAQTAQNALSAYGSAAAIPVVGYILAPIAAAMAVAAGAIQIAAIKKQQQTAAAQGYSKGGFTKPGAVNEPAGVVHAGEWVASQKLLSNPVARPMIDALDYAQRTNTIGSLRPDDVSRSITANNSLVRIAEGSDSSALMVAAALKMSQTVDSLTDRLNEPFVTINTVTGPHGINQVQDEYSRLMNNITPKSKRKS